MKNRRLVILLMLLSFQSTASAEQNPPVVNESEQMQKDFTNSIDNKQIKKENSRVSEGWGITKKILKYAIGGLIFAKNYIENNKLRRVNNRFNGNDEAKKARSEILSRLDKYKGLDYNRKVDGFLEEARRIISECNSNDKGYETDNERKKQQENDELWEKNKKEIARTSFLLIQNKKGVVCRDYTYVLGKMARKLGIRCYKMKMVSTEIDGKKKEHGVLLFAKNKLTSDRNLKTDWYILDGRNYSTAKQCGISNNEGLVKIEDIKKFLKWFGTEWENGEIYLSYEINSSSYRPAWIKLLNKEDFEKMQKGHDLCFNKFTGTWKYKKLEPLKTNSFIH